jgi:hypothetical protein
VTHEAELPEKPGPQNEERPFYVARGSMLGDVFRKVAVTSHVRAYGDVWVVDQRESAAPIDVYSLEERDPGLLASYFVWGAEPARTIAQTPDPWLTWELRHHLAVSPAIAPKIEPNTLEEVRVAYNVARLGIDDGRMQQMKARIEAELDRSMATVFEDGTRLLGVRVTKGAQPTLQAWFESVGPMRGDTFFGIQSQVIGRDPLSTVPADPIVRDMSQPPPLPTRLWKKGYIYHHDAVMLHRVGLEEFWGAWKNDGPKRADGETTTTLYKGRL